MKAVDRDIEHALIGHLHLKTTETWIIFVIIFMKAVDRDIKHALIGHLHLITTETWIIFVIFFIHYIYVSSRQGYQTCSDWSFAS